MKLFFKTCAFLFLLGLAVWQLAPMPRPLRKMVADVLSVRACRNSRCLPAIAASRGAMLAYTWGTIAIAFFVVIYAGVVVYDHYCGMGEPFSLFEGISIWPSEILRLAAAILGILLLARSQFVLGQARQELGIDFKLDCTADSRESPVVKAEPQIVDQAKQRVAVLQEKWQSRSGMAIARLRRRKWYDRIWPFSSIWWFRRRICGISRWRSEALQVGGKGEDHDQVDAYKLWCKYRWLGLPGNRNAPLYSGGDCISAGSVRLDALAGLARPAASRFSESLGE